MRLIDPQLCPTRGGRGPSSAAARGVPIPRAGRVRWLRAVVQATVLLACMPALAAGWIKLLAHTPAENFQDDDLRMFLEAARDALNAEGPPKTVEWSNARNGTGGSFLVLEDSVRNGLPCRRIRFSTYAPGFPNPPKTSTTWTACKLDGHWKLAEAR